MPRPSCYRVGIMQQLLQLLGDLDAQGLIHCDLKENQMTIGPDLKLRLTDLDSIRKIKHTRY
jgi:serine/threonine protein kinase